MNTHHTLHRRHRQPNARALLSLSVAAAAILATAAVPGRAHADDGYVEYANVQRFYDQLAATHRPAAVAGADGHPASADRTGATTRHLPPQHHHYLGYVDAPSRRQADDAPARVQVRAPLPAATGGSCPSEGYFLAFPNAEATGAAEGQTVNRATNDLD